MNDQGAGCNSGFRSGPDPADGGTAEQSVSDTRGQASVTDHLIRQFSGGGGGSNSGRQAAARHPIGDESTCPSRSISPLPVGRKLEPPVTKLTLSELDVTKIIHNPKLRHDINFDPELHFRPNLDGEKGRRKQEKANEFWKALQEQLGLFVTDRAEFVRKYGEDDDWCLPSLLRAVRDIIQTLVPARDREFLNEGLNVDLLMQQFTRGTVDLEKLASWLSAVLKQHCAPMRDEWVDDMYNDLSHGNRTNNMGELVKGMRSLLSVLEAMKLDVANHQIRCLRPVLIEDTVHFEQRFFQKKIQTGRLDIRPARRWYDSARHEAALQTPSSRQAHAFGETDIFFGGLCKLVLPSNDASMRAAQAPRAANGGGGGGNTGSSSLPSDGTPPRVPSSFVFDEERLIKLRSDMLDAINLEICMRVYEQENPHTLAFEASIAQYVADLDPRSQRNSASSTFSSGYGRSASSPRPPSYAASCHSANSSPRSSACLTGSSSSLCAPLCSAQQPIDFAEAKLKSRNLYGSLVALLHTAAPAACPAQRWVNMIPSIAVQIFRFLNTDPSQLPTIEAGLEAAFRFDSPLYQQVEDIFSELLRTKLAGRVKEFRSLSGIGLFSVATGGRISGPSASSTSTSSSSSASSRTWDSAQRPRDTLDSGTNSSTNSSNSAREAREEAGMEDIATRLAHLGILHWRVWAQLAYADGEGDRMET